MSLVLGGKTWIGPVEVGRVEGKSGRKSSCWGKACKPPCLSMSLTVSD